MTLTHFFYFIMTVVVSLILSLAIGSVFTGTMEYYDIGDEIHGMVVLAVTLLCTYRPFYLQGKKMMGFKFANEAR